MPVTIQRAGGGNPSQHRPDFLKQRVTAPVDKREILKRVFGHEGFREGQEQLVDELLGGHDVLGVMPTGAGSW